MRREVGVPGGVVGGGREQRSSDSMDPDFHRNVPDFHLEGTEVIISKVGGRAMRSIAGTDKHTDDLGCCGDSTLGSLAFRPMLGCPWS